MTRSRTAALIAAALACAAVNVLGPFFALVDLADPTREAGMTTGHSQFTVAGGATAPRTPVGRHFAI
ncbi:MAG: hypothetical protein ACXWU0_08410 [Rhodoplanes sp.]